MITWFRYASLNQKWLLALVLVSMVAIAVAGSLLESGSGSVDITIFSTENSIYEIAPQLGVTGKSLARELNLPLDISKKKPLAEIGISPVKLNHALEHLASHQDTTLKYYIYLALCLGALVFLTGLGKPKSLDLKNRRHWYPRSPYIVVLSFSLLVCGFLLGKSPNPMEAVVKVFKSMVGLYPDVGAKVLALVFFLLLAVAANKVICGWACPFGALQELIFSIPFLRKVKMKKIPFRLTNFLRISIFLAMIMFLFGWIGGKRGMVIYHYINPFNLFNLDFDPAGILIVLIAVFILSFGIYRPFCQTICPFGLVSWLFERISLGRVRINHDTCTNCGACSRACPTHAARDIVEKRKLPADCFSCMRCLSSCPVDALRYGCPPNSVKTNGTLIDKKNDLYKNRILEEED